MRPPPKRVSHVSLDARRRKFSVREEAFAAQWEYENVPRRGIGTGLGILQGLMFERKGDGVFFRDVCRHWIRNREAAIVATIVQWLGTNVGWCFLEESLRRCGWRLRRVRPDDRDHDWVPVAERLPTKAGRYLVWSRFGLEEEMTFLPGTVPGKTGIWSSFDGRTREAGYVVHWWEALRLHDWGRHKPYREEDA